MGERYLGMDGIKNMTLTKLDKLIIEAKKKYPPETNIKCVINIDWLKA